MLVIYVQIVWFRGVSATSRLQPRISRRCWQAGIQLLPSNKAREWEERCSVARGVVRRGEPRAAQFEFRLRASNQSIRWDGLIAWRPTRSTVHVANPSCLLHTAPVASRRLATSWCQHAPLLCCVASRVPNSDSPAELFSSLPFLTPSCILPSGRGYPAAQLTSPSLQPRP